MYRVDEHLRLFYKGALPSRIQSSSLASERVKLGGKVFDDFLAHVWWLPISIYISDPIWRVIVDSLWRILLLQTILKVIIWGSVNVRRISTTLAISVMEVFAWKDFHGLIEGIVWGRVLAGVVVRDNQRFGAGESQSGGWVRRNYLAHILRVWVRIVRWKHLALAQLGLHRRRPVILVVLQNYFICPRILGWTVSSESPFVLVLIWAQIDMPCVVLACWPLRGQVTLLSLNVLAKSLLSSSFELQILIKVRLVCLVEGCCWCSTIWYLFSGCHTWRRICVGESLEEVGRILTHFLRLFRLLLVLE